MNSLTPEQLDVLYDLANGKSVTAAADAADLHRTTIHHWIRTIPAFRLTLDAARQARIDAVRDRMNELAEPSLALLTKVVNDESAPLALRLRTALAILKFVATPQKPVVDKDLEAHWTLMQSAFSEGHKAGRATAPAKPSTGEIQHNSSHSSPAQSDETQTPRNALCPCGSGNKYKRCCGRNAPPVLGRAA
jgi:hypothetical protein